MAYNSIIAVQSIITVEVGDVSIRCVVEDINERSIIVRGFNGVELPRMMTGANVKVYTGNYTLSGHCTFSSMQRLAVSDLHEWRGEERRLYKRLNVNQPIRFSVCVEGEQPKEWVSGQLMNISASGVLISSFRDNILNGDELKVVCDTNLPVVGRLSFVCSVVRHYKDQHAAYYGCMFVSMSSQEQKTVLRWLDYLQQETQ